MSKLKITIKISKKIDKFFSPFIKIIARYGISANHISLLQMPFVIIFFFALISRSEIYASVSLGITLFLDVLDGTWARVTNSVTKKGYVYDKVMDLFGIYAFLIGTSILFPQIKLINIILGICTALLYFTNMYIKPEIYCGTRTFGFLGLLYGNLYVFLLIPTILSIVMLLYKFVIVMKNVKI